MSDPKRASKWLIWGIRIGIILLAILTGRAVFENLRYFPRTEDAEVRANVVGVAPQVGGSIIRLPIKDNQLVKRGDLLFELDARPYEAEVERAKAKLDMVRLEVRALQDEIVAAEAAVTERFAKAEYATSHAERLKLLLAGHFISQDKVQQAEAEAQSAAAKVREAEAAVARARNQLGEYEGKNRRIEEAQAILKDAELKVSYCKVFAACDGYVTNLQIAPGTFAAAGEQIFSLVDASVWFVLANFRETDLARILPGQRVKVYLMSERKQAFVGIVQGIPRAVYPLATASRAMPSGEGVFSKVEPTFDFVQLAQRFPVRIILEHSDTSAYRMGGKAAVVVDTRNAPDTQHLQELQARETPSFISPEKP